MLSLFSGPGFRILDFGVLGLGFKVQCSVESAFSSLVEGLSEEEAWKCR